MPVVRDLHGKIPLSEAFRPVPANEKIHDIDDEGQSWDRVSMLSWTRQSDGYKFMTTTYPSDVNGRRPLSVSDWAERQSDINTEIEKVCAIFNKVKSDDYVRSTNYIGRDEYNIKKINQKEIEFTLKCGFSEVHYTINITDDDTDKQKLTDFLKRRIS
tara:strand:+ start:276 stop:749 length:474 start_codon:yes stop_codon:yes gene_type:complete